MNYFDPLLLTILVAILPQWIVFYKQLESDSNQETKMPLGDRMKWYEAQQKRTVMPYLPLVIRIDGKKFSRYCEQLPKPFNMPFAESMARMATDILVLSNLSPSAVYVESDEVSIVFAPRCTKLQYETENDPKMNKFTHPFGGRLSKLETVIASFAAVRFVFHMNQLVRSVPNYESIYAKFMKNLDNPLVSFDARSLVFPEGKEYEVVNHMFWRSNYDCYRNAVSHYAYTMFSNNDLEHNDTKERINRMKVEKGFDFNKVEEYVKYGTYIKRGKLETDCNGVKTTRSKPIAKAFAMKWSDAMYKLLVASYWDSDLESQTGITFYNASIIDSYTSVLNTTDENESTNPEDSETQQ
jgi:tRNA(His) 5'-end guanylyltransferase